MWGLELGPILSLVAKYLALFAGFYFLSLATLPLLVSMISAISRKMRLHELKSLKESFIRSETEWRTQERPARIGSVGYATSNGAAKHHD